MVGLQLSHPLCYTIRMIKTYKVEFTTFIRPFYLYLTLVPATIIPTLAIIPLATLPAFSASFARPALGPAFADLATLRTGTPADIVLFDPDLDWVVDTSAFESMGRNTPLQGTPLKGRVMMTMVAGEVVYQDKGIWPEADGL